jgi:rod shape-determining protein MreC
VLLLALAAITLMLVDVRGGPTGVLRSAGALIAVPMQAAAGTALDSASAIRDDRMSAASEHLGRIDELERRNAELSARVDMLSEQVDRSPDAEPPTGLSVVAASVVAAGPAYSRTAVAMDVGSADGVSAGSAVLSGGVLVGRVVEAGPNASTAILLDDPASVVAVRVKGSRETALARGTADPNSLALDLYDPLVAARPGDELVTLGSPGDRPYPPGLRVGTIADVVGAVGSPERRITVEPAADLTSLDRVQVVLAAGEGSPAAAAGGATASDGAPASDGAVMP